MRMTPEQIKLLTQQLNELFEGAPFLLVTTGEQMEDGTHLLCNREPGVTVIMAEYAYRRTRESDFGK